MTVKRFQPLEALAQKTRLELTIRVDDPDMIERVMRDLADARGGSGTIRFIVPLANGGQAIVLAGRDFALDGELASRIERSVGEGRVDLSAQEPPKLALVG